MAAPVHLRITRWIVDHLIWDTSGTAREGFWRGLWATRKLLVEPGHDGWVVGDEPVVLIEFDFEGETVSKLGMPEAHRHG